MTTGLPKAATRGFFEKAGTSTKAMNPFQQADDDDDAVEKEISIGIPVAEQVTAVNRASFRRKALDFISRSKAMTKKHDPATNSFDDRSRAKPMAIVKGIATSTKEAVELTAAAATPVYPCSNGCHPAGTVSGTRIMTPAMDFKKDTKLPVTRRLSFARFAKRSKKMSTGNALEAQAVIAGPEGEGCEESAPQTWKDAAKQAAYDAWWARRDRELRNTPGVC